MAPGPTFQQTIGGSAALSATAAVLRDRYEASVDVNLGVLVAVPVVAGAIWIIWHAIVWPRFVSPLRHLPEPPGGAFLNGHFRQLKDIRTGVLQDEWINHVPNDGLIKHRMLMGEEWVIATSPAAVQDALVAPDSGVFRPIRRSAWIRPLLGDSLLLVQGEEHRKQRKELGPAFTTRRIRPLYSIFWEKAHDCADLIRAQVQSGTNPAAKEGIVPMKDWMRRLALDNITLGGMGWDFDSLRDPDSPLCRAYTSVNTVGWLWLLLPIVLPLRLVRAIPVRHNREARESVRKIRSAADRMLQEKKQRLTKEGPTPPGSKAANDVLALAIEAAPFTDANMIDTAMGFLGTGHETVTCALSRALVNLCKHPSCQVKIRDEIRANKAHLDSSNIAGFTDRLTYLHAFVNETLRLSSPVVQIPRQCSRDTVIGGHAVPKGTKVWVSGTNHSISLWGPSALEFAPERWLEGKSNGTLGGASSKYALQTFGHGPQGCIGQGFARGELLCSLAILVDAFEMDMDDTQVELECLFAVRPKGPLNLRMKMVETRVL